MATQSLRNHPALAGALALILLSCAPSEAKEGLGPAEPSPVAQLIVTPASATLEAGAALTFEVGAVHEDGTNSVPAVTWAATGGSITAAGLYTSGNAPGTYSVTASLVSGSLSRSAAVSVVAATSPIVSINVSPSTASLFTGESQQFSAVATRQDGSTLTANVTWTATGGGVSSGGLYTAGGGAGTYRVIATQQGGALADTSTVILTAPSTGPYPHRPANYTTVIPGLNFSQAVPAGGGNERYLASPSNAWSVIFDADGSGGSNFSQVTDPTAPGSPADVWRLRFAAGTWSSGHSIGYLGRALPSVNEVYISFWIKWDPQFEFNTISTKLVRLQVPGGYVLIQARHSADYLRASDESIGQAYEPQNGAQPALGVWHQVEIQLIRGDPGTVRVWVDGQLRTSYTNLPVSGPFSTLSIDGHLGGGGMTKVRDSFYWLDDVFIATP